MSANNYILITEVIDHPKYLLSDECIECAPCSEPFTNALTLECAIYKAHQYMEEEIVEYGIRFSLLRSGIVKK